MTRDEFALVKAWVRAEAKLIAADIAGHHPNTIAKHVERVARTERAAQMALRGASD